MRLTLCLLVFILPFAAAQAQASCRVTETQFTDFSGNTVHFQFAEHMDPLSVIEFMETAPPLDSESLASRRAVRSAYNRLLARNPHVDNILSTGQAIQKTSKREWLGLGKRVRLRSSVSSRFKISFRSWINRRLR